MIPVLVLVVAMACFAVEVALRRSLIAAGLALVVLAKLL